MAVAIGEHHEVPHRHCEAEYPCFADNKFKKIMVILEKLALIAMTIFAAYISPKLFFPFFGFGVILGVYLNWGKKEHDHAHAHDGGGCSVGFTEQLAEVRLPQPIGLAANVAVTICHIEHHKEYLVPLTALIAGMGLGKLIAKISHPIRLHLEPIYF